MSRGDRELGERLRDLRAPDEAASEERSWELVRAAYAERGVPPRPSRRTRRLVLAVVGGAVALAIGLSPAGAKVADLVGDAVGIGEPDAKPALRSLPAEGELMVSAPSGLWVVSDDGSKRLLGEYGEGAWSPNGLYVVAAAGRELVALEPDGDVRWAYSAPGEVHDPRWVGTALDTRIAYRSGDDLRVIVGDGNGDTDRLIARDVAPVAPAWRPVTDESGTFGPYVLTYVDGSGHVRTVDADTGERRPTTRLDRLRLAAAGDREGVRRALSPAGDEVATLERVGASSRLFSGPIGGRPRPLFSARGDLTGPTWSPDGRWVLVGWPAADQWLMIEAERPHTPVPFGRISEQFDPGDTGRAHFPRVEGWVLPAD